jgi:hypothetical protein
MKTSINPMQSAHAAPRCRATSKRSGKPCRAPAVRGWTVCRMHGAGGGAPSGPRNGRYRHGCQTQEFASAMRRGRELMRWIRESVEGL